MRCVVLVLCLIAFLTPAAAGDPIAVTQTLTFDGLVTQTEEPLPRSYGGLTWENMWVLNPLQNPSPEYAASGYFAGIVSGDSVAFNAGGAPATVLGSTAFTFNSAHFTAAWNTDLNLNITAYSGDAAIFAVSLTLNPSGPLFFAPNWSGIDRLSFASTGGQDAGFGGKGTHFALDNFVFTSTPIPEPSTLVLLGTSLLAALAVGGRRQPR
jgi:PEP-CTERM motif